MAQPREQPDVKETRPQDVVNLVYSLACILVGSIAPFIRSRFGIRAFASYIWSALLMFCYAGFGHCPLMAYYLVPWLLMIAVRRITADQGQHSRYQGYPWVFGWMAGERVARVAEVFLCFLAAVAASEVSEPLADFLLVVCVALVVVLLAEAALHDARRVNLRDAKFEAEYMGRMDRGR